MGEFPQTIKEFEQLFTDEAACLALVRRYRWPSGFACPRCGGRDSWTLARRRLEECRCCGHQASITARTLFARTRKPLSLWFRVLGDFLIDKRGCSALGIARRHGLSYQTAWTWLHKIRSTMERDGRRSLDERVEMMLMLRNPVHKAIGTISGAVEKRKGGGCGRVRLSRADFGVPLAHFAARNCAPLTMVKTEQMGQDAEQILRRAELIPYWWRGVDTPALDCVFIHLRRQMLGTYHGGFGQRHGRRYLDEFVFRFNRRRSRDRGLLLHRALQASPHAVPTFRQLAAGPT